MKAPFMAYGRSSARIGILAILLVVSLAPGAAATGTAAGAHALELTVVYDTPACGSNGARQGAPLVFAPVELRGADGVVARARTNASGLAKLKVPQGSGSLEAQVELQDDTLDITQDALFKSTYRFDLGKVQGTAPRRIEVTAAPPGRHDAGVAPYDRNAAGAMNIWSDVKRAETFSRNALGGSLARSLKPLDVRFRKGVVFGKDKDIAWSVYNPHRRQLSIGAQDKTLHEYADDVIFHEYGHYLMDQLDIDPDTPGGSHAFESSYPNKRGLALSEGFATAFAAWVQGKTDTQVGGCTGAVRNLQYLDRHVVPTTWSEWHAAAALRNALSAIGQQAGTQTPGLALRAMVAAFRKFGTGNRAPQDLREARDALLGLETDEMDHAGIDDAFSSAGVGWGIQFEVFFADDRNEGGGAHTRLTSTLQGPGINCAATGGDPLEPLKFPVWPYEWHGKIGARGGLNYTFHDDCLTNGGQEDEHNHQIWLLYPYVTSRSQLYGQPYRITTTYSCRNADGAADDPAYACTNHRRVAIRVWTGTGYNAETSATLSQDEPTPVLSFGAKGKCTLEPSGQDCEK
jgi:hypothetical protein